MRGLNHAEIIRAAVAGKKNILTVGATGSGKTTFVNAVLDVMAEVAPNDRVVSIEDTTELQCSVPKSRRFTRGRKRVDARLPPRLHEAEAHAHCGR